MNAPRLEAVGLRVSVGPTLIVDGVDLSVPAGAVTALLGPNGAGKSTLFDCLSGVRPAARGTIRMDGVSITRTTADARSRRGLARTFQHLSVFPTLTVEENLLVGAEHRARLGLWRAVLRGRRADDERTPDIVEQILRRLGLTSVRDARAEVLSTATLRLVELGRALCTRPTVLMLDEPASGLDDDETALLRDLLPRLAAEGLAVLLVEHDLTLVRQVADRYYAMEQGRVVASGPVADLETNPDVLARVGGTRLRRRGSP
jgi:branched-chain amino acid transport system ATP-binding protein